MLYRIYYICVLIWRLRRLGRRKSRNLSSDAADGIAYGPIATTGRTDGAGGVEVETVGLGGARSRGRRPIAAKIAGEGEQVGGILVDDATPNTIERSSSDVIGSRSTT